MKSRWESDDEQIIVKRPKIKKPKKPKPEPVIIQTEEKSTLTDPLCITFPPHGFPTEALAGPPITPCRSVALYEKLNRIDEGSYGIVYRARNKETGEIVALKKLKLNVEKDGFPITSLREIYALLMIQHPHIVSCKEIVVTPSMNG
jgi:cell division cycle 2-like protein